MRPVLACPSCAAPLDTVTGGLGCANGHTFDAAREGYVNLLLAHNTRSHAPGDSRAMIDARHRVLEHRYYQPVTDTLADVMRPNLRSGSLTVVADAGCGEGYYLRRTRELLAGASPAHDIAYYGLDVSKYGVRMAARCDPGATYVVASSHRLPLVSGSVDVLLSLFAPVNADEFSRVTSAGGTVLVGAPGRAHLFHLRQLIYRTPRYHDEIEPIPASARLVLIDTVRIRYSVEILGRDQVESLLGMTPYYWSASRETQTALAAMDRLDTEIDILLYVYRNRQPDAGAAEEAGGPRQDDPG